MGRGGRILLDRSSSNYDDIWARLDYTIFDTTVCASDDSPAEVIESKSFESTAEKIAQQDSSEKILNPPIHNNQQNNTIVIKSENSKILETSDDQTEKMSHGEKLSCVNNQKLDDFEQLLDIASASSNIINKKLVCRNNSDISEDSFLLVPTTGSSSLSQNDLLNKNLLNSFNCEASSSGVSSTNGSLSFNLNNAASQSNIAETTSVDATKQATDDEDDEEFKSEPTEDFFTDFIEEIKTDWLHFRPKTPSSPHSDAVFDSDLTDNIKNFAVELQMLEGYKEDETNSYTNNLYHSQPMSYNLCNNHVQLNDENIVNVKTEPTDTELTDDFSLCVEETNTKKSREQDAVKRLLEKYKNDVSKDEFFKFDIEDTDFDECDPDQKSLGCSTFKLSSNDLQLAYSSSKVNNSNSSSKDSVAIKTENTSYSSDRNFNSIQNVTIAKEAPIAELQSHNYVLQYGSPVSSNTVTLNSIASNSNILSCGTNLNTSGTSIEMNPTTTLFQQQFINSGSIMTHQSQHNKLQPIVYDSNTIVLAAAPTRKQINGPSDRNCNYC